MPKIQRANLPPALLEHLLDRVITRDITVANLHEMQNWIDENPTVPVGDWFNRFGTFTICGKDSLVMTFLTAKQVPVGTEAP